MTNFLLIIVFSICIQFVFRIIFSQRISTMISQENVSGKYKAISYIILILIPFNCLLDKEYGSGILIS